MIVSPLSLPSHRATPYYFFPCSCIIAGGGEIYMCLFFIIFFLVRSDCHLFQRASFVFLKSLVLIYTVQFIFALVFLFSFILVILFSFVWLFHLFFVFFTHNLFTSLMYVCNFLHQILFTVHFFANFHLLFRCS